MRNLRVFVVLLAVLIGFVGCQEAVELPEGTPPADFCLVLYFEPSAAMRETTEHDGYNWQPAVFVLEPDRTLRTATGPGCSLQTYPEPTTRLTPEQVQTVYDYLQLIDVNNVARPYRQDDRMDWIRFRGRALGSQVSMDIPTSEEIIEQSGNQESLLAAWILTLYFHYRAGLIESDFWDPDWHQHRGPSIPGLGNQNIQKGSVLSE